MHTNWLDEMSRFLTYGSPSIISKVDSENCRGQQPQRKNSTEKKSVNSKKKWQG
jgi:hypothetical protein